MEDLSKVQLDMQWERPSTVPFPHIWHKFETKSKNGITHKIRIEDLTPDRYEKALLFMTKYYLSKEPLCVSSKLLEDEESVKAYQFVFTEIMKNKLSLLVVLDEDSPTPEIAAVDLLSVETKNDSLIVTKLPGKKIQQHIQIENDLRKSADPFHLLQNNIYLSDWGSCVKPDYQGLEIGYNILLSLPKIAKAFHIDGARITFTCIQSQILAERVGFKVYSEIVYEEYRNEHGEVIFPVKDTKSIKHMVVNYI